MDIWATSLHDSLVPPGTTQAKSSIYSSFPSRWARINICGSKVVSIPRTFENIHGLQLYMYFAPFHRSNV